MIVTLAVLLLHVVPHAALGQEGKIVGTRSVIPGMRGDACWHDKQRVFPGAVVPWDTTGKVVREGSGVDVCGAWPTCGTCVRMYEGDCRYVYPTFVLTYNIRDPYGPEQICACKVKSCYLPWDSAGWDKNCVQELGCFNKVALDEVGPFCQALARGKAKNTKPMKVKFVPMEFSKQSFKRPGIVAVVETEEIVDGAVTKKISEHVIHPDGKEPEPEEQSKATAYIAVVDDDTVAADSNPRYRYQHNSGKLIDYDEHSYSFSHDGTEYYMKLHKTHDSVCVKYYGSDSGQQRELANECVPIPGRVTTAPMMYNRVIRWSSGYEYKNTAARKMNFSTLALKLDKMLDSDYYENFQWRKQHPLNFMRLVEFNIFGNWKERYIVAVAKNKGDKFVVQRIDAVDDRIALGEAEIKSSSEYHSWAWGKGGTKTWYGSWYAEPEKEVCVCEEEQRPLQGRQSIKVKSKCWKKSQYPGVQRWESEISEEEKRKRTSKNKQYICPGHGQKLVESKQRSTTSSDALKFYFYYSTEECAVWGGDALSCRDREEYMLHSTDDTSGRYYDIPGGMFLGYSLKKGKSINEMPAKGASTEESLPFVVKYYAGAKAGSYTKMIAEEGTRGLRERCGEGIERCRYNTANTDGANILCLSGGGTEADAEEYEIRSRNDREMARTWVKRHHKMLRRYVLIDENGHTRRVACDDKYSVSLDSLSQTVLSNSTVHDGQFIFPEGFSKQDAIVGSTDPCTDPESKIAYYYESGTFASTASGSARCSHPVVQYYAPNKKMYGCASEYVSMDDYRPLTFSNDATASGQSQKEVILQPLAPYERGLCVNNFPTLWYEPKYLWFEDDAKDPQATTEFVILRFKAASDVKLQGCQFFKIEAWGGGEAAMETETRERRSGRPGQYMMAILRNPVCGDKCDVFAREKKDRRKEVKDLELFFKAKIGEGGEYRTPKKGDKKSTLLGAGGDTVVEFCVYNGKSLESCYEIMRAVGGGSEDIGKVQTNDIGNLMQSYRTITGDVLAGDSGAQKLLLEGRAMFTKFPLEINLPLVPDVYNISDGKNDELVQTLQREIVRSQRAQILQLNKGRSMPKEFCKKKDRYYTYRRAGEFFIPGMGGCWGGETDVVPGLGESGAVAITCEQWGTIKPTFDASEAAKAVGKQEQQALAWSKNSVEKQQMLHKVRRQQKR
ncbi:MAG: hypothetical protein ACTJLL_04310 [Anaplasma sp.]